MNKRRSVIAATLTIGAVLAVILVARTRAIGKVAPARRVLKIANQKASTKALLSASGQLDNVPYEIEWSEFPAAGPMLAVLAAGAADTALVGDEPFMFAYGAGAQIKVVRASRSVGPEAGKSSGVVVPAWSSLRAPADLRGHKVGTVKGSTGHYVLLRVLERAGLQPQDVSIVYLSNGDSKSALLSGAIDAWATWGTYVAVAVVEDNDRLLADSTGLRTGLAFQAATEEAIAHRRDLLEDFLRRLNRAHAWALAHRDAYIGVLSGETGIPPRVLRYTYEKSHTEFVPITAELQQGEVKLLETFKAVGLLETVPNIAGAFDASFNTTID
jgi:sulfonate transport system substrate-binding protein